MLNLALLERDRPVGVVLADRRGYEEAPGQLGVDDYLHAGVQLLHELSFVLGVGEDVVIDVPFGFVRLAEVFTRLLLREDVDIVMACTPKFDPGVMRVSSRLLIERNSHEA